MSKKTENIAVMVSADVKKESAEAMGDLIDRLLGACASRNMSGKTTRHVISEVLRRAGSPEIHISDNHFDITSGVVDTKELEE